MEWKKIEVWLLILIICVIYLLACLPAESAITDKYECDRAKPFMVYVINPNHSIRAIMGFSQEGWIICQGVYCEDENSRWLEGIIREEAEQMGTIRNLQLP